MNDRPEPRATSVRVAQENERGHAINVSWGKRDPETDAWLHHRAFRLTTLQLVAVLAVLYAVARGAVALLEAAVGVLL